MGGQWRLGGLFVVGRARVGAGVAHRAHTCWAARPPVLPPSHTRTRARPRAQAISRGITKAGVGVATYDLEAAPLTEVAEAVLNSDGFILGACFGVRVHACMRASYSVHTRHVPCRMVLAILPTYV